MEIDRQAIMQTFLVESEEHLREMEEALIALENRPDDQETLDTIFRVAHTVKGGASCLGFETLTGFAHVLEDLLVRLCRRDFPVTGRIITLLLQSVDALAQMVPEAIGGNEELTPAHAALLSQLRAQVSSVAVEQAEEISLLTAQSVETARPINQSGVNRTGTLRVEIEKLDRMLNLTGEMAVARERIRQMLERAGRGPGEQILEAHREEDRLYTELQELVMKVRMVPVGPTFRQFIRTVRDLAISHGKNARLTIEGADVEVDTSVIELLKDPLTHMIRNALDHGIETPDVRRAAGKNPQGQLTLSAHHEAGNIVIQISDDGCGFNRERIIERAVERGLACDADRMTDSEVYRLVFEAGFSTAETVTDLSGRGVGMDVVRRNIESLRGTVEIDSRKGLGATISIRLPLTLAIIDGFSVGVADETFVIPLDSVLECLELPGEERRHPDTCGVINLRGEALPYVRLRRLFDLPGRAGARENIVVVQHGTDRVGLVVEELHGENQTVIKPLSKLFRNLPGISGSAILGDGRVALVLDVPTLLRKVTTQSIA
ncbi:MAG TPA: chemotaxis protein CheA [Blastocatellia bacterium]|nr:chemotaxis protein CheA [Blastocatellia bacterium]